VHSVHQQFGLDLPYLFSMVHQRVLMVRHLVLMLHHVSQQHLIRQPSGVRHMRCPKRHCMSVLHVDCGAQCIL